jgi:opacity protein-like surface antigen
MKLKSRINLRLASIAAAGALAVGTAMAASDVVTTSDPDSMVQWYGRAGGLAGSDAVTAAGKAASGKQVKINYDKDVAQRTNMGLREGASRGVGVAYDKDVVERTNMQRGQPNAPIQSATVPGQVKN